MKRSSNFRIPQRATTVAAAVALAIAAAPQARAAAAETDTGAPSELQEVVVTGTRQAGISAIESPAPVQILSAEALKAASGNPDLMSVISQLVPSVTMEAFGFDQAGQTLMAKMRGLSPNDVLILVDGKRRHTTANLAVDNGSAYTGGANVDLNFIPLDAIDHIEVLTDGAAAQYGSDAVAGVINIILKKNTSGGSITATDGKFFDNQGPTSDVSGTAGFAPWDDAYFDITGAFHNHGHTNHTGLLPSAVNEINTFPNSNMEQLPGWPYLNKIIGDAEIHTKTALVNAGSNLFGEAVQFYVTGSYGHKDASSFENYRIPEHVSYTDPTTLVTTYPDPFGFYPREATDETDYQATAGFKGVLSDWKWDLAYSYGKDHVILETLDSIGSSFYFNGLPTISDFYDGFLQAKQAATTLDINRDFDVGTAGPLNVAFGAEYRLESYSLGAGTPLSYEDGGAQSYAGLSPTDASSHNRKNYSVYVDLDNKPIEPLRIDLAGRYEHYSDFGNAEVGKATARWDFSPQLAVRGTVSNGFRAPTLAEEYYSSTNVAPSSAFAQLPPNSPGGKLLGLGNGLSAEKSINYSVGFVFRPLPNVSMTLDIYQITVTNRIANTANIFGILNGVPQAAAGTVAAAIAANGASLPPEVGTTGLETFANGIDTRTRGADFTFNAPMDYAFGHIDWVASATWNETVITKLPTAPPTLPGATLYDAAAISDLTTANPKFVLNFGGTWTYDNVSATVTEKIYGPSNEYANDGGDGPTGNVLYFNTYIGTTPITNIDLGLKATKYLKFDIGAINLFNRFPVHTNNQEVANYTFSNSQTASYDLPGFSPFGIDGGFYYAKATFSW
jgi:iron complex outermembrane recepter protein